MPASLALASLFERRGRVSAAAILGARHGELVGSLSASDLRGLGGGGAGGPGSSLRALGLPVGEFVKARAAAAAAKSGAGPEAARGARPPPLLAVGPDTPFSELVRLLAECGHHRAYVVEEIEESEGGEEEKRRRALGVISLSDVLRFACK